MIRLYPEQLAANLQQGLQRCYLLSGNEPLLLQESQDAIRQQAATQGFTTLLSHVLDKHTDWPALFEQCQSLSLFAERQILLLQLPEGGVNAALSEQLLTLSRLLHDDLLLILQAARLTKAQENSDWYRSLLAEGAHITCMAPEASQLPTWIKRRAEQMQLQLDQQTLQLLCFCYEGNLLALRQCLQQLTLLYPDGKLTLPRVEQVVNNAAHFTPWHWLDALLAGKSRRALHIVQQLQQEGCEPLILLRTVQRELLLLLQLKQQMQQSALRTLFDQHKVWQNRRALLTLALQRLTGDHLCQAIALLARLELSLKHNYDHSIWQGIESLSLLLCGKLLPESLLNG
ncbi:MAG: DNA polymerase III subunit delta [Enterobacteriaceae bacterium]